MRTQAYRPVSTKFLTASYSKRNSQVRFSGLADVLADTLFTYFGGSIQELKAGIYHTGNMEAISDLTIGGTLEGNAKAGKHLKLYGKAQVYGNAEAGESLSVCGSVYGTAKANQISLYADHEGERPGFIRKRITIMGKDGKLELEPDSVIQGDIVFEKPGGRVVLKITGAAEEEFRAMKAMHGTVPPKGAMAIAWKTLQPLAEQVHGEGVQYGFVRPWDRDFGNFTPIDADVMKEPSAP